MGWGLYSPQPYELAILPLAALPPVAVAIVAISGDLYRVDGGRNDAHPTLAPAIHAPAIVLGLL